MCHAIAPFCPYLRVLISIIFTIFSKVEFQAGVIYYLNGKTGNLLWKQCSLLHLSVQACRAYIQFIFL